MGFIDWLKSKFTKKSSVQSSKSGPYVDLRKHGRVYFPAKGRFVQESHYANNQESFNGRLFPKTETEGMEAHLNRSFEILKRYLPNAVFSDVYNSKYKRIWTPANDGSINEYGQASRGDIRPSPVEELWQGNMNFVSLPAVGTKYMLTAPNGKKCVIQMGYERGPGSAEFLGGLTTEVHYYLGTHNESILSIDVCPQDTPLGPYEEQRQPIPTRPAPPISAPAPHTSEIISRTYVIGDDHKIAGIKYLPDPDMGDVMIPKGVVIHFTCSYNMEGTVSWFKSNGVDIHLLVDKTGELVQMVPFNRKAAHAGVSKWGEYESLNDDFIGIEVISIGPLVKRGAQFFDCYGRVWRGEVVEREMFGHKYWEPFTAAQMQALYDALAPIMKRYLILAKNICGHHECSPGRKTDPGGSLIGSMEDLRKILIGVAVSENSH
ncbi:N-acetylmuramoyl-L-alanine amidase [Bdellovibrio bacteriovorus]|uniref:N-acetylmuramoyl-L-alanine amidase n=1 Tax=Bdellovibrio bacteriovorus TaxID=959 RepID=UPI0035A5F4C5